MKVLSFKRLLGLAAIGGAYAYARKHGGLRPAFDHLMSKKDELTQRAKDELQRRADVVEQGTSDITAGEPNVPSFDRH
jgi:hypothetical protein